MEPDLEDRMSDELVELFTEFWISADISKLSPKSQRKYSTGLWELGGYLVKRSVDEELTGELSEKLDDALLGDEGPLVFHENPYAQNELDSVCRKFNKWRKTKC